MAVPYIFDIKPVANYIEAQTGKRPYEWGFIAGRATRRIFTDD